MLFAILTGKGKSTRILNSFFLETKFILTKIIIFFFFSRLKRKFFPPVDADSGVKAAENIPEPKEESDDEISSDESNTDVDEQLKKKPKKEKVGFRDRKV